MKALTDIVLKSMTNITLSHGVGITTVRRLRSRGVKNLEKINDDWYVDSSYISTMEWLLDYIKDDIVKELRRKAIRMTRLCVNTTRTPQSRTDKYLSRDPFTGELFDYYASRTDDLWGFAEEIVGWHHSRGEYLYVGKDFTRSDRFESTCFVYGFLMVFHKAEMEWFDKQSKKKGAKK